MGTAHKVTIDGKSYTPREISAMILQKLKSDAEAYLGETVTQAVITVLHTSQTHSVRLQRMPVRLRLDVKRIINEPTAAALSYGVDKEKDQKVMVYDLGGGTFDVSIIEMGDSVQEVLATAVTTVSAVMTSIRESSIGWLHHSRQKQVLTFHRIRLQCRD